MNEPRPLAFGWLLRVLCFALGAVLFGCDTTEPAPRRRMGRLGSMRRTPQCPGAKGCETGSRDRVRCRYHRRRSAFWRSGGEWCEMRGSFWERFSASI